MVFALFRNLYIGGQLRGFLVRTHEHEDYQGEEDEREHKAYDINCAVDVAGEEVAELVYHKGDNIGEAALIADCEPGPLCTVHLTLDSADSCEAGSAQKVEDEERISGYAGERLCKGCINVALCAIEDAHRTDDVLFCDKSGDRSDGSLPVAPAERNEDPGDSRADLCEQGLIKLILCKHSEVTVYEAEVRGEPDNDS